MTRSYILEEYLAYNGWTEVDRFWIADGAIQCAKNILMGESTRMFRVIQLIKEF